MENGGVPQSATPESLLKEAIHVISCGFEDKTDWGSEIGWISGSVTEDILTGFKMHARGWRSIYCMPKHPAFKGSAPINLSDCLNQVEMAGEISICQHHYIPSYIHSPSCLLHTAYSLSAHWEVYYSTESLLALIPILLSLPTSDEDGDFAELCMFKWTTLLITPTALLIINLVGVVAGVSYAINSGYQSWGPLFGKLFFAFWVIIHLYPFLKGLMGRQNRTPTIVVVWAVLLASIFSLLWVRVDPFTTKVTGPDVKQSGINC
ncbi:hypothetical protein PTKIN_Ptkin06aG0092600 [Pterospermum kingtungense]